MEFQSKQTEGSVTVMEVSGALKRGGDSDRFESELTQLIQDGTRKLIVNLSSVHYIDSAGLGILVGAAGKMNEAGGQVEVGGRQRSRDARDQTHQGGQYPARGLRCRGFLKSNGGGRMKDDWGTYFELAEGEELARLHRFTFKSKQEGREVEFFITVHEYAHPPTGSLRFFAQADKQTNQKLAPYTPSGWGSDMISAVSDCINAIRKFPYQGD